MTTFGPAKICGCFRFRWSFYKTPL